MGGRRLMDKKEWRNSSSSLRKLIRETLKEPQEGREIDQRCEYKFGIIWNGEYRYFHIWNGQSENTIATVKLSGKRAYIRYRENSWYAHILKTISIPDREMVYVKSN